MLHGSMKVGEEGEEPPELPTGGSAAQGLEGCRFHSWQYCVEWLSLCVPNKVAAGLRRHPAFTQ